jgi:predicted DsbA family dithiol-disulfide isomerase
MTRGLVGRMQIDIVSDMMCPWSFVGKRWLEEACAMRPEIRADVVWHSLQLYPEMPSSGMDRNLYLAEKFGSAAIGRKMYEPVAAAGSAVGIPFAFERIRRIPNTRDAHRFIRYATARGKANAAVEAVFTAYFVETRDIGRAETLAEIGGEIGFDAADAAAYLASSSEIEQLAADQRQLRRRGLAAVPTFIFDRRHAIAGAHEPEILLPILDAAAKNDVMHT